MGDGNGVAIESTTTRLRNAFHDEPRPVFVGKVRYIDFDQDVIPEGRPNDAWRQRHHLDPLRVH